MSVFICERVWKKKEVNCPLEGDEEEKVKHVDDTFDRSNALSRKVF